MNKKIISLIVALTLIISVFPLSVITYAADTDPRVEFILSDDIDMGTAGTQVTLTLMAYNMNFNGMQFALGFDTDIVQLASKSTNNVSTNFTPVSTINQLYGYNEISEQDEGWLVAPGEAQKINNATGTAWFAFYVSPDSKEITNGSNADGYVEAGVEGLEILKLHFAKLGDIDANTFKILSETDPGGDDSNETGLILETDAGTLKDPSYVVFDLGEVTPPADTVAPEITLIGDATITITKGDTFTDPGVTITDNVDTGLVPVITYTKDGVAVDSIDTNVPGTYIIHYNVTDTAGNAADEVTRTVIVKEVIPTPGAKITVGSATAKQGETVTVPVNVADLGEAYGYQVAISYDTAVFTNAVITNIAGNASETNTENGEILVAAGSEVALGAITKLFDIELTISETAAIDTTNLTVTEAKLAMNGGEDPTADVLANATDGVVTVVSAADKENLIALIGEVEELLATTTAGDKPGQYGTTERTALETALETAETVRDDVSATPTEVTNAETALTDAKTAYEGSKKAEYGDVSGDGTIDSADVTLVLKHIVKLTTLEGDLFTRADVNGDEFVDISDAVLILRFVNDKLAKFPVEQ